MIGNLLSLLVFINFTWLAPPAVDNVTKVEIHVSDTATYDPAGQVIDAGLPPVVNGKQSFQTTVDVSTPKYFFIQGRNSFGLSDPGVGVRAGKPVTLGGLQVTP